MRKSIYIGLVLLGFTFTLSAQEVEFKSSNFKDDKDGFKAATDAIKSGDEFLELGNEAIYAVKDPENYFESALRYFMQAQKFNPKSADLNLKIGNCLLYTNKKSEALQYLETAKKLNPEVDDFLDWYLGQAYQLDGQYDEALKYYKKFEGNSRSRQIESLGKMLDKRKKECNYAKEFEATPIRAWVDNVSTINSEEDDFSPCLTMDGASMLFNSRRPNSHKPDENGVFDSDIYYTEYNDGKWSKPTNVGAPLNTEKDEVASVFDYNGQKMMLFKKESDNYDIYESKLVGAKWGEPYPLDRRINTSADQTYSSYNYNHTEVMFITNRESGLSSSGADIYSSGKTSAGDFTNPTTMGSEVNSKFNEGSVYMALDGKTMYICSEGFNSMGGYDIFVSYKRQGQWTEPQNLGYPINTPYDDMFFASNANGMIAYIASNRKGGKGGMDIYKVTFWGPEKELLVDTEDFLLASVANPIQDVQIEKEVEVNSVSLTVFKGKTIDHITKKPVEAKIEIVDNSNGRSLEKFITNSASGKFLLSLTAGKNYGIAVQADGYLFHSENFDIANSSSYNLVDKTIELKNIAVGSKIALRNVFFDTGKSDIKPESHSELDRLVGLLKDVPSLKIELGGHTDNTGSESLNKKLSQDRATAVMNYLISKGISKGRLSAKGYGSSEPVDTNKSAEGRANNRRTEFTITAN